VEALIIIVALAVVVWVVSGPLRRGEAPEIAQADRRAALEAARDAKYREIRDAEADRAAGKLSDEDFQRLDRELRREAIEILRRIDRLREPAGPSV
jgi:uncharacterized membrane protein